MKSQNKITINSEFTNLNKKENNNEHFGYIVGIYDTYGVVRSNIDNDEYYFEYDSQSKFSKNDKVIFLLNQTQFEETASALRLFYTNEYGLKFYPRVNQYHIHLMLDKYLPDIIKNIKDKEENILEVEFEYPVVIGKTICVKTDENDSIIYAIRKGRNGYTRFVKNRNAEDCNSIFAAFKRTNIGYIILTIFIGKKAAREPWDKFATNEDILFWKNHALIYDTEEIISGSKTIKCPLYNK
jgi:hypothetical protein